MAYGGPTASAAIAKVTATITGVAGQVVTTALAAAPTAALKAASATIFDPSHPDPTAFDPTNPIVLFIIQAIVIVSFSRGLAFFLGKIRQPRVISEVVAGIIIGPSAFGRIPGFTAHIFPPASLSYLNLVATLGLILFLFLVGLEVDFSLFRSNYRASASISAIGMIVPFALGAAVSKGIYDRFVDDSKVGFGTFLLFIGTANAITAFPVLARILTELDMLQNHVGVIVLTAGVGNDVCGWVLLALAIALVNASSSIIVLYVLLTSLAWILMLFFVFKPLLVLMCRRTGSFGEKGPTQGVICAVVMLTLASSFITDRIGIHAIFGAFIVGLIVPREIRSSLTEKIEDLVSVLFLPLYFALSGLKTDLGLLANGSIWGWTICVIVVAFAGKFFSCGLTAKANGMDWRESGAVGSLMACKGLVELIVLNIGLSAGILNPEVFAMFVTMALVTTFATTPLTLMFYPLSYRVEKERLRRANDPATLPSGGSSSTTKRTSRFTVVLDRFDHLPAVFAFVNLIKAPLQFDCKVARPQSQSSIPEKSYEVDSPVLGSTTDADISLDALRLIELSDRTSALLKASETQESLRAADSLSQIFRTFSTSLGINTSTSVKIVAQESFSSQVASHAAAFESDFIVVPWAVGAIAKSEVQGGSNPFEGMFRRATGAAPGLATREGSPQYASFVRNVFAEASCDVGLFVDRSLDTSTALSGHSHLFFAFHAGPDDRTALELIIQLVERNPALYATIIRIERAAEPTSEDLQLLPTKEGSLTSSTSDDMPVMNQLTIQGGGATDTIYPIRGTLESSSSDSILLAKYFTPSSTRSPSLVAALSRIAYSTVHTSSPLHLSLSRSKALSKSLPSSTPLIIISGRSRRDAPSHTVELNTYLKSNLEAVSSSLASSSEVRRSLGDAGTAYFVEGIGSLLVVQSRGGGGFVKAKDV